MGIATTYKEFLLEKFLLAYLKGNIIPTSDQLEADLDEYQTTYPNLTSPTSKFEDFSVGHGSESSASQIQTIANAFSQDVSIVIRELYRIALESSKLYERWSYEIKRLDAKARKIEQRVDSLLLLTNNTAGYFASVGDVFSDLSLVDTSLTTTLVNINEGTVTLNPGTSSYEGVKQIDTTVLTLLDVSFVPLSTKPGTAYFPLSSNNDLINIFKTNLVTWVGKITGMVGGQMVCELKTNISKTADVEVSRIAMEWAGPSVSNKTYVSLMYSVDGYTWNIVPVSEATKPVASFVSWNFPLTAMRWIKFIITKLTPDSGKDYLYSIRNVRIYGSVYSEDHGTTFVSKSLNALNTKSEAVGFSLAQLETCETLPTGTTLDFYLSASKDNTVWTDWTTVLPSGRTGVSYPRVVNFGGAEEKNNSDPSTVDVFNTIITGDNPQMQLATTFDDFDNSYRFKTSDYGIVNTVVPLPTEVDTDTVGNSIILWRNIRSALSSTDTSLVRSVSRGWGLDGQTYSCYFEVVASDGKIIDFGGTTCLLDGQTVTGVILVAKGIHKFSTSSENWKDISLTLAEYSSDIANEETLAGIDPLYPYNHKLLIEGFPYVSLFTGEKKYTGTDISAEFYSTKTSLFDLENNDRDYSYFAVRGIGNDSIATIVRYNNNNTDYTNELFLLKWKYSSTELYKYIKLKAEFGSTVASSTSSLSSYRIKLGL